MENIYWNQSHHIITITTLFFQIIWFLQIYIFSYETFFFKFWLLQILFEFFFQKSGEMEWLNIKHIWFLQLYKFSWETFFFKIFDFYKFTNSVWKLFFRNFWFLQINKFCLNFFSKNLVKRNGSAHPNYQMYLPNLDLIWLGKKKSLC